jgi:hypothetical protein
VPSMEKKLRRMNVVKSGEPPAIASVAKLIPARSDLEGQWLLEFTSEQACAMALLRWSHFPTHVAMLNRMQPCPRGSEQRYSADIGGIATTMQQEMQRASRAAAEEEVASAAAARAAAAERASRVPAPASYSSYPQRIPRFLQELGDNDQLRGHRQLRATEPEHNVEHTVSTQMWETLGQMVSEHSRQQAGEAQQRAREATRHAADAAVAASTRRPSLLPSPVTVLPTWFPGSQAAVPGTTMQPEPPGRGDYRAPWAGHRGPATWEAEAAEPETPAWTASLHPEQTRDGLGSSRRESQRLANGGRSFTISLPRSPPPAEEPDTRHSGRAPSMRPHSRVPALHSDYSSQPSRSGRRSESTARPDSPSPERPAAAARLTLPPAGGGHAAVRRTISQTQMGSGGRSGHRDGSAAAASYQAAGASRSWESERRGGHGGAAAAADYSRTIPWRGSTTPDSEQYDQENMEEPESSEALDQYEPD